MQHYIKLKRLFTVLDQWKSNYLFAGLLMVFAIFVRMLEPKMMQVTIDGVILLKGQVTKGGDFFTNTIYKVLPQLHEDNRLWGLVCIGLLLFAIAVVKSSSLFFSKAITAMSTEQATKRLRDRLFSHIQALPLSHFSKIPSGDMIQRCTGDVTTVQKFIGTQVVQVIRLFAVFLASFTMMYGTHPLYAFICIASVPILVITSTIFFVKESKIWEEHEATQDKLTAIIQENLSGIRVVQAFAQEEFETEKFIRQNKEKRAMGIRNVDIETIFWPLSDLLINLQISVSVLAGGYFLLNGQITLGEFVSFFAYAVMVTWPMREVGRIVSQAGMAAVAMDRVHQILATKAEDYTGIKLPNDKIQGSIEFKNVNFRYTEEGPLVLDDLSFKIEAGENIAIMGAPGAGKSTIIALLARFYEPTSGEILIDGTPLKKLDKTWLRKRLGIVWQKPFLFSTTVEKNIIYEKNEAEKDELLLAAQSAAVAPFIHKLSKGYQTTVGEKGVALSGGQKQRVALARTLLADPDLLILDDATSAVDTETEFQIQKALAATMKGKTSLIIAHRLTSVQHAQRIFILDKGKIIEQGSHNQLLDQKGYYKKIYELQIEIEDDILG